MLPVVLTPRAREDIVSIAAYTLERWGEAQMAEYVDALHRRFEQLQRFPRAGRRRTDLGSSYRSLLQGSHVIFYRTTAKAVVIVRILHGRMSPQHHLP